MDCQHPNLKPTGEIRLIKSKCKERPEAAIPLPVYECPDCKRHFVKRADGRLQGVVPPLAFGIVKQMIQLGRVTGEAAAERFGNLSEAEREELRGLGKCEHDGWEPVMLVYKCRGCGLMRQEKVEQIEDHTKR